MMTAGGKPVLLVEDNKIDIANVHRTFSKGHIENPLLIARTGQEAFVYLQGEQGQPRAPAPGLILLDLNMPVMGGLEFLSEIKADTNLQGIPVVVLTTSGEEADRINAFRLGCAGYFIKPMSFSDFVKMIHLIALYWELSEQQ